jgi:hypothetical protein
MLSRSADSLSPTLTAVTTAVEPPQAVTLNPPIVGFCVEDLRKVATEIRESRETPSQIQTHERLIAAHDSLIDHMVESIRAQLLDSLVLDQFPNKITIFNPQNGADLQGFHHLTIVRGFHDKKSNTYSRRVHHNAGIRCDPITVLERAMKGTGITKIRNISDSSKSFNFVIEVHLDE